MPVANGEVLQQKIDHLEDDLRSVEEEVKELNRRMNSHDTSIAKIELIVEGMKTDWAMVRSDIQRMMESQTQYQNQTNTRTFVSALKEVAIELVKTIGLIVAAFLAAKTFFK